MAGKLLVTKENDQYRWTLISSNSYMDREGEIVSQSAHEKDIERMDQTGNYGTLDWWHVKVKSADGEATPLDIGNCDFAMMYGRMRIESGTFLTETIGKAFSEMSEELGVSLEFYATPLEAGAYETIVTVRRALLPANEAANSLTAALI